MSVGAIAMSLSTIIVAENAQLMITGDSKTVANSVAKRKGIDEVAAEVLPAEVGGTVRLSQLQIHLHRGVRTLQVLEKIEVKAPLSHLAPSHVV